MNSTYLKSIRIVYFSLAMGIVLFLLVTFFVTNMNGPLAETTISATEKAPFIIALIILTGTVFMIFKLIFPKKIKIIQSLPTLEKKLITWRELCILQGALIEAPAFFAIVLFLLIGVYPLLIWPLVGILLFWLKQPSREKLIIDAKLSTSEIAEFDNLT